MKQKLIKVACIFFALMILFTILSRVADSLSIAKVSIVSPDGGVITRKISGEGQIVHNQEMAVFVEAGQTIKTVFVNEGEQVEAGKALFQLDTDKLEAKILEQQQELTKLDLSIRASNSQAAVSKQEENLTRQQAGDDYNEAVSAGNEKVRIAGNELQHANDVYEAHKQNPTEGVTEEELLAIKEEKQSAYDMAIMERSNALSSAKKALDSANIPKAEDTSAESSNIDRAQKALVLSKLQQLREQGGAVVASGSGVITKVNVATGGQTGEEAAILLAEVAAGIKAVVQIPVAQQKYVATGDAVSVSTNDSDSKKKMPKNLKISSVQANKEDKEMLDVTVLLPSDAAKIGSSATVEIERESKNYATCIPITALRQDGGEYYVLIIQESESVLGAELVAQKLKVTVVEKNEEAAALGEGELTSDQKIITESNKVIEDGSRVRLQES